MRQIALITGASAGIGRATALLLTKNNFDVIITGRRKDLIFSLKNVIENEGNTSVLPLVFDIRNFEETKKAINSLTGKWKDIDVLINNAGLAAGLAPIHEGSIDDWEQMIDTNIKGLVYISRIISPLMVDRGHGHIVNIGSIAGKDVYENGNVYCATKFAVDALSKSMRIDLLKHNIKVTMISPGLVETEFSLVRFKGDRGKAKIPYKGIEPLIAEDIAECILFALTRPPHVCVNEMTVTPTAQANSFYNYRK